MSTRLTDSDLVITHNRSNQISLALLDYASGADEIEICQSVVRRPCRNDLLTYWTDFFHISVVASPGPYTQTLFEFMKINALSDFSGFFLCFR